MPYEIGPRHHADYPSPMTFTQERMKLLLGSMAAVAWLLRLGAYVCLGMAAVLLALILWMEFSGKAGRFGAFLRYALLLAAAGIVALFSLSVTMPELSAIPRWVGTIGLFNFFIVALALFVGLGVLISDRFGVPVLALLVVFAIAHCVSRSQRQPCRPADERQEQGRVEISRFGVPGMAPIPC